MDPMTRDEAAALDHAATRLTEALTRLEANHTNRVREASALGTNPGAADAWELVHEAAGITATTRSRLTQLRWTA